MAEIDWLKKFAKLPKPEKVKKWIPMGSLTREEEHYVVKILEKVGEINALTFLHPLIDHERLDPYIRRKIAELEEILPKVRH